MPIPASILMCLSEQEKADFLPGSLLSDITSSTAHLIECRSDDCTPASFAALLHEVNPEVLVACWLTPSLPDPLPSNLRYVCYLAGSIKKLVQRQHIADGLLVTNWGSSISRTVAEGALMHILCCLRGLTKWTIEMHLHGGWKNRATRTASLFGRRVGIRGFGRVAHELMSLLRPFGCDIAVLAPDLTPEIARTENVRRVDSIAQLMTDNEVIVELAPLIDATRGSITRDHLELLRPGSVFVNVGRGATVNEADLLEVARRGEIFVGLDVFGEEPLPADSGFRGLPNVSLSPHLAGPTSDRRVDAGRFGVSNLLAYVHDQPLDGVVTLPVYDQST